MRIDKGGVIDLDHRQADDPDVRHPRQTAKHRPMGIDEFVRADVTDEGKVGILQLDNAGPGQCELGGDWLRILRGAVALNSGPAAGAVGRRRLTEASTECAREGGRVIEAAVHGNVEHRAAVEKQAESGTLQPQPERVSLERLADLGLEGTVEMKRRVARTFGQPLQR